MVVLAAMMSKRSSRSPTTASHVSGARKIQKMYSAPLGRLPSSDQTWHFHLDLISSSSGSVAVSGL